MRISDWSSDVCSSDLDADRAVAGAGAARHHGYAGAAGHLAVGFGHVGDAAFLPAVDDPDRVLRVVQRVDHPEIALDRHAEPSVDTVDLQLIDQNLDAGSQIGARSHEGLRSLEAAR